MAPHSSTLAWKIPWTEEPGRVQSMGSLRVGVNYISAKLKREKRTQMEQGEAGGEKPLP